MANSSKFSLGCGSNVGSVFKGSASDFQIRPKCVPLRGQYGTWVLAYLIAGFPCGSAGKESACSARDLGSIPGWGRSPGEWKGYPLQYSGLENSMNCIVIWGHKESDTTE